VHGDAAYDVDPAFAKKSYDERLDAAIPQLGYQGIVGGVVSAAAPRPIVVFRGSVPGRQVAEPWLDYQFTVESFTGRGRSPYTIGSTITVRAAVARGTLDDGSTVLQEDVPGGVPVIHPGDHILVLYHPQAGDQGAGNSASRLVVPTAGHVYVVRNGTVFPDATTVPAGVSPPRPESLDRFLAHFQR
jgi:hypothetical protein